MPSLTLSGWVSSHSQLQARFAPALPDKAAGGGSGPAYSVPPFFICLARTLCAQRRSGVLISIGRRAAAFL